MPFHCKQFSIEQSRSSQKVGSDSMLLGAWTKGDFKNILDIGTGTGLLALMQAQKHLEAIIIAIEPDQGSFKEAILNFRNSKFSKQLTAYQSNLQIFQSNQKFDLIISNPPYFENDFLSSDAKRNSARHTNNLSIDDLYFNVNRLLDANGFFYLVFPKSVAHRHYEVAESYGLHPVKRMLAKTEKGDCIRHFVCFSKIKSIIQEEEIIIKYNSGLYSQKYVELTQDYYLKNLPFHIS